MDTLIYYLIRNHITLWQINKHSKEFSVNLGNHIELFLSIPPHHLSQIFALKIGELWFGKFLNSELSFIKLSGIDLYEN